MNEETGESRLEGPLTRGEVLVFSEENFGGEQQRFKIGISNVKPNSPVASIQFGPGTGATLFEKDDCSGLSQDLTADLSSFKDSRLEGKKPASLIIWPTADRPFSGWWAIEVAGRYLAVSPDRVLITSDTVNEYSVFRIANAEGKPGEFKFIVRGELLPEGTGTEAAQNLTIDDLQQVLLSIELEAGFRKFALMTTDDQYICYNPNEDSFSLGNNDAERAIFCKSIKLAETESQVGELVQGEVALFENAAYWGKAWVFYADYANFKNVVDLNDEVSSIQLGPMTGVTIYLDVDFNKENPAAAKQDVTTNMPSLKDEQVQGDQISSIDIWRIVPPEEMGLTYTCKLSQDFRKIDGKFVENSAYRTTLSFPSTVEMIDLSMTDEADIEIDGQPKHVSEDNSISIPPNLLHRLVITSEAGEGKSEKTYTPSLRAPGIKIHTNTMGPEERIVIHPDQSVHERLANLENDELYQATYRDNNGDEHPIIKDKGKDKKKDEQKQSDVANAQSMIKKVMSTVKYTSNASGGWDQTISADGLAGKNWALDFSTYRVTVRTLFVREGPDTSYEKKGYVMMNQVVQVLGFNATGDWVHIKRLSDGLTGWSFGAYLGIIHEKPTDKPYRVNALALQVREGPGTVHRQVGLLNQNEIVTAVSTNEKGTWIKIYRKKDKLTGWCYAPYLTAVEEEAIVPGFDLSEVPETAPAEPTSPSGLTPMVHFHEISQEEVQALLARSKSPQANVDQESFSLWDDITHVASDIYNGVKAAGSIIITAVEKSWAVIVDLGNKVIAWVVDTAEKAIACVEGIIEKIGAAIEEIIKWLRFIFDWNDILDTQKFLSDSINTMLNYLGKTVALVGTEPVDHFFKQLKATVNQGFNQVISQLDGSSEEKSSTERPSGQGDAFEAVDWVLSKIMGAASDILSAGSPFDYKPPAGKVEGILTFWNGALSSAMRVVNAPQQAMSNAFSQLLKEPDKPQKVIAELLCMLRDQVDGLLEMGQGFVDGLLKLAETLITEIQAILNADLRIPFISELIEWIGTLSGKNIHATLGFSIMDACTLIMAIPVTISSKIALGRAPFDNVPALALEGDAWTISAGWACYLNSLVSIPLDMVPEGEEKILGGLGDWLEGASLLFSVATMATSWGPDIYQVTHSLEHQDRDGSNADWLWWTLFGYDCLVFGMDCVSFVTEFVTEKKVERVRRSKTPWIVLSSVLGGVHLILVIAKKCVDQTYTKILPEVLMAAPDVFPFLRLWKSPYLSLLNGILDGAAGVTALTLGYTGGDIPSF